MGVFRSQRHPDQQSAPHSIRAVPKRTPFAIALVITSVLLYTFLQSTTVSHAGARVALGLVPSGQLGARRMLPAGPLTALQFLRSEEIVILNNSDYFAYVADAMHHSFVKLGIQHSMASSIPEGSNATFIMFVTHEGLKLPTSYISYNFEQLTTDKQWPPELFKKYRGARMVWDYSLENIKVLKSHGINNIYHVPLGYDESMENPVPAAQQRDIDVVFVGAINDKRHAKLKQLESLQLPPPHSGQLKTTFSSAWGVELSKRYRKAKVGLNLHYFGGKTILEVHRILPLLISKVLVLSEPSDDPWLDTTFAGIVNYTASEDISQSVVRILSMDIDREAERRYQQLLHCCRYSNYLQAALQRPFPVRAASTNGTANGTIKM